ncbi:MAG: PAS domain-containing protein [Propionivibrio sp.]|nr:PAS domain-containing protein [Propionivibrio sp.]
MVTSKPAARTGAKPAARRSAARQPPAGPGAATDAETGAASGAAPASAAPAAPPLAPACPIVGIGASAGGLEAFEAFFRACPADTGMAFVLVPHLDPGHQSLLTEILQRATAMPVVEAFDQLAVAPNHVYVIPPNREMLILNGALQLSVPELVRGQRMPIDGFLRSLAEDQAERAIGIILSGTASDGTLGLRAILGGGGVCLVQEPATAKYDGMPRSAINAGYATHILPVEQMPAALLEVVRHIVLRQQVLPVVPEKVQSGINQILLQLRSGTGHDFSLYKKSTIGRRIQRRMAQNAIEDEAVYARFLKGNPVETQLLFRELLINVTSFFRDPEAFDALKDTILPALLKGKPPGYDFRVWVAGCASGEEAYSIAIVLHELQDAIKAHHDRELSIQIYATDLDDEAIATARAGRYPPNIAQDMTAERLRRFFSKDQGEHGGYKVKKDIRDMVVFAVQNVIKDPPFTKLDLLSCRNLMIYLEPELQNRLIPSFHYALRPNGVLFLSTSESITGHPDLFTAIERKWKFYRASHTDAAPWLKVNTDMVWARSAGTHGSNGTPARMADAAAIGKANSGRAGNVAALSTNALLQTYAPASVTTDSLGNILYVHGDTGRYLRPAPGPVSNNVVEMAREGLQLDLRVAIDMAATVSIPTLNKAVSVKTNGGFSKVCFSVRALPRDKGDEPLLLVSFEDIAGAVKPADPSHPAAAKPGLGKRGAAVHSSPSAQTTQSARIEALERELAYAKENLQATGEEQQASNEELKSTNEELQSTNEELQSSNEELETSKEELQSLNEETITVNSELNARVEQLTRIQNDMKNLLDSISTGTLFLDHQLTILRYTPAVVQVYPLIAGDVGRPLSDIASNLVGADLSTDPSTDLLADLQSVLDTLIPVEREVRSTDGAWYLARIQPYRTLDNAIEGVVLTFTPVTEFKLASEAAQRTTTELATLLQASTQLARELAEGIVNTVIEPLIVLDGGLQVISASRSFYEHFQVAAEQTVGRKIYDLGNGQWDIPALRQLLEKILPQNQAMDGYVVEHNFPGLGQRRMVLNARRIVTALGNTELILLAMVAIDSPD